MRERYRVRWFGRFWRSAGAVAALCLLALTPSTALASPDRHSTVLDKLPPADLSSAALAYVNARSNAVAFEELHAAALASEASIPAFARKYGLRCSACHTVWPELNSFGQKFKDNGYQLGNDRDSPIWMSPNYWPVAIRTTVGWNMERTTNQIVEAPDGTVNDSATVTQSGFDISGFDLLMLGTLAKNITFGFVPTYDAGEVDIETAFVRFDNLLKSTWANLKVGKFELDNILSEKRILTLSANGGLYQSYHFNPVGSATNFGLGDNQIGAEVMGHNANSYTRYSVAVLDATDGEPGNAYGQRYDYMFTLSQAFDGGKAGVQRIGAYAFFGQQPTSYSSVPGGDPIAGSGTDNKKFYRIGVVGDFFYKNWELLPFYLRGQDNAYLANGVPGTDPLGADMQDAKWNGYLGELHYYFNPQFLVLGRAEWIRMSQQGDVNTPSTLGNIDAYTIGTRWYPIMTSRTGLAVLTELSTTKTIGTVPLSGDGTGEDPRLTSPPTAVRSTSLLFGLDYDF